MVSLRDIQSSNSCIPTALPAGLVAIFVGATSGIGETTLKQFAKHALKPRVYFVGRSQEAGDRVFAECKALNPEGEYNFIKADVSLIRGVDDVCREIKSKEKAVNLLVLSQGTLFGEKKSSEGLHVFLALVLHSRARFIINLLPLLQQASDLRRVVTILAAGKEGPIDTTDFQAWKVSLMALRGHTSSMVTLSLEALAKKAPDVSFIHCFPGNVKGNLVRGKSALELTLKAVYRVIGTLIWIPSEESGERHLFLATSARFPPGTEKDKTSGVPLAKGIEVARGISGETGGGVYSVNWDGETTGPKVEELIAKFKREGTGELVWNHIEGEYVRITGLEHI